MKKTSFFLFLFLPMIVFAQNSSILVELTNLTDSLIFPNSRFFTRIAPDSIKLHNIPKNTKNYKIKQFYYEKDEPALNIFYGITNSDKRQVIFDTDFDGDLKGEYVYTFDSNIKSLKKRSEDNILSATPSARIKFSGMTREIHLKPVVFNGSIKYNNPQDSIWHLFIESDYDRVAEIKVNGQVYKLYGKGELQKTMVKGSSYYIVRDENKNFKYSKDNPAYKIKEPIPIGNITFTIDSVSTYQERAWITFKQTTDSIIGHRVGELAKNIVDFTIEEKQFNLHNLKNKYVLLDFWGSWCGPCVELIPEIRELHLKYKNQGLEIVSIGCDKKADFDKMRKIIYSEKMDWTHVFTEYDKINNIAYQYGVSCFPTSIIINKEGKIVYRSCGTDDFYNVKKKLAELFEGNSL